MEGDTCRVPSLFLLPFVLACIALLLGIGLLNSRPDLVMLCLLLLGLALLAHLWTRASSRGLDCRFALARRRAFPGETIPLTATAANRRWLPIWLLAEIPAGGLADDPAVPAVSAESGLLWYQRTDFHWQLTARQRGVYRVGPLHLAFGDLLGFFTRQAENGETQEVLVYPRLVALHPLTLPRRDFFGVPGPDSPVQDPIHILGTRDYRHGGPARHIHWKATARHHRLQEKIFEPTVQEKVLLLVDTAGFAAPETKDAFEKLVETAASAAAWLDERGCAVGLATNGRMAGGGQAVLPVARAPQQLTALCEAFARLLPQPETDLVTLLRERLTLPWGATCLCFTLAIDAQARAVREHLGRHRTPVRFVVVRRTPAEADRREAEGAGVWLMEELRAGEERA